jgi:hypothetical protein
MSDLEFFELQAVVNADTPDGPKEADINHGSPGSVEPGAPPTPSHLSDTDNGAPTLIHGTSGLSVNQLVSPSPLERPAHAQARPGVGITVIDTETVWAFWFEHLISMTYCSIFSILAAL